MNIGGIPHRTIWVEPDGWSVGIIDQTRLPHAFVTLVLRDVADAARAIRDMQVRGAPLIGAAAAPGVYHATSSGATTWHGLAREVFRLAGAASPPTRYSAR